MSPRKLLFYDSLNRSGCWWYRIHQPAKALIKHVSPDDMIVACTTLLDPEPMQVWVDQADAIYSGMLENDKFLDWMEGEQARGRRLFFDYDDDPFNVSPFNPAYEKRGLKEVEFTTGDGRPLGKWKDGQNGFSLEENQKRADTFIRALRQCDLLTTPNAHLADKFSRYSQNVKLIKNMIDLSAWRPLPLVKDDRVRIIYQGGWSHFGDWQIIKKPLKKVMEEHKNVDLVVMGQTYEGILKEFPQDRVQRVDWVDVEAYPYLFRSLDGDIGICPLEKSEFNLCKSELKWEEYSALEIPAVCSQVGPYIAAVDHGLTGFLAKNETEWEQYLTELILSPELRRAVGRSARRRVEDYYDLKNCSSLYLDAFRAGFGVHLAVA